MNALLERKGTQYIIDVAAEVLGNPVFIGDASYKVFLCSNEEETEDDFWKEVQRKTFPSDKEIIKAFRSGEFYEMYAQDEPVLASFPTIRHRLLGARYRDGNQVMGHIVVYELRQTFQKEDYELLHVLCKALVYEMLYREKAIMQNVKYHSLISELLEGKQIPEQEVLGCLELAHIKLPKTMRLLVMQSQKSTTGVMRNYIREQILNKCVGVMAITYAKFIVFIFDADKAWEFVIQDFCERYVMTCGVSYCFENLNNLKVYYRQAVKAIELSLKMQRQETVNYYKNYAIYDLIEGNTAAPSICHPYILKLAQDDKDNHTNNLSALEVYLKHGGNIAKAAEEMCIHKNSMYYRISRIEQILDCDLQDGDLKMLLYISLKILQMNPLK